MRKAIFIAILALSLFGCGGDSPQKSNTLTSSVDRPSLAAGDCLYEAGSFHQTAGGVTVRSCVEVPAEALTAIELGIAHQIRNSSHYNPTWTAFRDLHEYQVFLVPPTAHNQVNDPGSPALMVRYLTTSSSVDQVQSAGTCIGVDGSLFYPGKGPVTDSRYPSEVLPEQSAEHWQYLKYLEESARNESEHIAEWANNRAMFKSFAIVGDVHPHFEDWQ